MTELPSIQNTEQCETNESDEQLIYYIMLVNTHVPLQDILTRARIQGDWLFCNQMHSDRKAWRKPEAYFVDHVEQTPTLLTVHCFAGKIFKGTIAMCKDTSSGSPEDVFWHIYTILSPASLSTTLSHHLSMTHTLWHDDIGKKTK